MIKNGYKNSAKIKQKECKNASDSELITAVFEWGFIQSGYKYLETNLILAVEELNNRGLNISNETVENMIKFKKF